MSRLKNVKITIECGDRLFQKQVLCCCAQHMLAISSLILTNYIIRDPAEMKMLRESANDRRILDALAHQCREPAEKSSEDRLADREMTLLALSVFRDMVKKGVATIEGPFAETAPAILDRLLEGEAVEVLPLPPLTRDSH